MGQEKQAQGHGSRETQQGGKTQDQPINDASRSNNPNRQKDDRGSGGQSQSGSSRDDHGDTSSRSGGQR
jgi:hypothetical protein